MNSNKAKRRLSLLLILTVAMTFTLMSTVTVNAAAKKKTVWRATKSKVVITDSSGKQYIDTITYSYNKNGLTVKEEGKTDDAKHKTVYKRQKSGAIKSSKTYYNGKLSTSVVNTVKKGLVTKSKRYSHEKGKKTLEGTTTYTYKKGKLAKAVTKSEGTKYTRIYKNGIISESSYTGNGYKYTATYDKKGNLKKDTSSSKTSEENYKITTTYDTFYNKKGDITKVVAIEESNHDGVETASVTVSKYTNKYDKHGNLIKQTVKSEATDNDGKVTKDKTVSTWKYKKFKVAKKYLKYIAD